MWISLNCSSALLKDPCNSDINSDQSLCSTGNISTPLPHVLSPHPTLLLHRPVEPRSSSLGGRSSPNYRARSNVHPFRVTYMPPLLLPTHRTDRCFHRDIKSYVILYHKPFPTENMGRVGRILPSPDGGADHPSPALRLPGGEPICCTAGGFDITHVCLPSHTPY